MNPIAGKPEASDRLAPLRALLARHVALRPEDAATARRIEALLDARRDCLLRTCEIGHVTAAALVLSSDLQRCLLTHHKKLGRWLQLGGHVDGEPRVHLAALREALEESGLERLSFLRDPAEERGPDADLDPLPLDLDVHPIPAHGKEPAHEHHDVRFLLVAEPGAEPRASEESLALAWRPLEEVARSADDGSVSRLARRALERIRSRSR